MMEDIEQTIEELTLLLLYLTSWKEEVIRGEIAVYRAWKGYPFETLNALETKGLINQSRRAKSVTLTEEGIRRAEELKGKYLCKRPETV